MKTKGRNLEITITIIFLTSGDFKLQNRLFLDWNFASKKNATFKVLLAELYSKSEKGYGMPGTEIAQPTIFDFNHTVVVQ
jgi:hypothetical protein